MLTPTHRTILALESQRWKYAGAKQATVREQLGISYTRYCQLVLALLDNPHAEATEPLLIRRLRRLRDARRVARSLRSLYV
jgi:hypothetical protein